MTSARKLILLSVTVAFLLTAADCAFASAFDDLFKQYPDFARLLALAAPKCGLSKEQLDKVFDNTSTCARESNSQQG